MKVKLWSYQCRQCYSTYKDIIVGGSKPPAPYPECSDCDTAMLPYELDAGFICGAERKVDNVIDLSSRRKAGAAEKRCRHLAGS